VEGELGVPVKLKMIKQCLDKLSEFREESLISVHDLEAACDVVASLISKMRLASTMNDTPSFSDAIYALQQSVTKEGLKLKRMREHAIDIEDAISACHYDDYFDEDWEDPVVEAIDYLCQSLEDIAETLKAG